MKIEVLKRDENIRLFDGRTATLSAVRLPDGICDVRLYTNDRELEELAGRACHSSTWSETPRRNPMRGAVVP